MAAKKVSNQINHVNKSNSVLIVSGSQAAKIYELRRGSILQDPAIQISRPAYTDREGLNRRRGKGSVWGTASDYEAKDDGTDIEFIHELQREIKNLAAQRDFEEVYLFAPRQCFQKIKSALPKILQEKVAFEYRGNFTKFDPSRLLQKITSKRQKQISSKRIEIKDEPKKILQRKKIRQSGQ